MDYPISVPSVGLVGGKFVDEDPLAGTPGSLIPAQWGNGVTEEILNVITAAGLAPSEIDNAQLVAAIRLVTLGRLLNTRYFMAVGSTTYVPTPGTKKIRVRVIGGGGGGGGIAATTNSAVAAGGGGSGGGYAEGTYATGFAGVSIIVGGGGVGGAAGPNFGGTGATSSFGSLLSATGGEGGFGCLAVSPPFSQGSGFGGTGSGGSINSQGTGGSPSIITLLQGYQSGVGGGSAFGGGGSQRRYADQGAGRPGAGPGGGGSGAAAGGSVSTAALAGGVGAAGIVIVEEYT